jgi:hypothetical protein
MRRARTSASIEPHGTAAVVMRLVQSSQATPQQPVASLDISHRRHRNVQCTACHRSGERHGEVIVRTVRDCQSCHHATDQKASCGACHQVAELRETVDIATRFAVSVRREAEIRSVAFRHSWHSDVQCTTCHTTPVTLASTADCASCHTEHHVATAECRLCHAGAKEDHTRQAHLGCAGSGCHSMRQPVALQETRNVCLTCHVDMVNHRTGRECAGCHEVRWLAERRPGQ